MKSIKETCTGSVVVPHFSLELLQGEYLVARHEIDPGFQGDLFQQLVVGVSVNVSTPFFCILLLHTLLLFYSWRI